MPKVYHAKIGDRVTVIGKGKKSKKTGEVIGYVPWSLGQYIVKFDDGTSSLPWYFELEATK